MKPPERHGTQSAAHFVIFIPRAFPPSASIKCLSVLFMSKIVNTGDSSCREESIELRCPFCLPSSLFYICVLLRLSLSFVVYRFCGDSRPSHFSA